MNTRPGHKRFKIIITVVIFAALIVGNLIYLLADRYLIEHREYLANAGNTRSTSADSATVMPVGTATGKQGNSATVTQAGVNPVESTGQIVSDTWNYQSTNIAIQVSRVETGSGDDKVTYYVADIKVSDISYLFSAFAKDTFGRNIVQDTSAIAANNNAILAINGDYYGFRTDGVEIRNGILYRDNPARVGAAIYSDGTLRFYDETDISAEQLLADGVLQTFSFGPILVENGQAVSDFTNSKVDSNFGNAPSISGNNPRTGIGMISANHFVFIVVDGRSRGYSRGVTLAEFARIFTSLGCTAAYNLDGGGSSTLYFQGQVVNNPLGHDNERAVSDIIYITER